MRVKDPTPLKSMTGTYPIIISRTKASNLAGIVGRFVLQGPIHNARFQARGARSHRRARMASPQTGETSFQKTLAQEFNGIDAARLAATDRGQCFPPAKPRTMRARRTSSAPRVPGVREQGMALVQCGPRDRQGERPVEPRPSHRSPPRAAESGVRPAQIDSIRRRLRKSSVIASAKKRPPPLSQGRFLNIIKYQA